MAVNPEDPAAVGEALLRQLEESLGVRDISFAEAPARLGRGMDTFIYSFQLTGEGLEAAWDAPLVLRLYPSPDQAAKARKEADVQRFAAARGYPAVEPLMIEQQAVPFGLPIMVMPRVDGETMLDLVVKNPLRVPRLLSQMARLHVALHRLPVDGWPLPHEGSLVDRKLAQLRRDATGDPDLERALQWLETSRRLVAAEDLSFCHHDFHPLNILLDGAGNARVLDWSDAELGDRHSDIARSRLLFWVAPLIADSAVERIALKAARGYLQWQYLRAYRRDLPVDEDRLRYWTALHAYDGWQLIARLRDPAGDLVGVAREDSVARLPLALADQLQRRFWKLSGRD